MEFSLFLLIKTPGTFSVLLYKQTNLLVLTKQIHKM